MPDENIQEWTAVDGYISDLLIPADPAMQAALDDAAAAGLPQIQVSAPQGKLLHLLARVARARRVLEIGTLGGYSTIWLARALPDDGELISLELDPRHAEVARANISRAGLAHIVEIRVGRALDTLVDIEREGRGPFDLVFIDADKPSGPDYFTWALKLSHPGTVIIVDNVVRHGAILDAGSDDVNAVGARAVNALIGEEPRVSATIIQTVGGKGYDGFAMALVGGETP